MDRLKRSCALVMLLWSINHCKLWKATVIKLKPWPKNRGLEWQRGQMTSVYVLGLFQGWFQSHIHWVIESMSVGFAANHTFAKDKPRIIKTDLNTRPHKTPQGSCLTFVRAWQTHYHHINRYQFNTQCLSVSVFECLNAYVDWSDLSFCLRSFLKVTESAMGTVIFAIPARSVEKGNGIGRWPPALIDGTWANHVMQNNGLNGCWLCMAVYGLTQVGPYMASIPDWCRGNQMKPLLFFSVCRCAIGKSTPKGKHNIQQGRYIHCPFFHSKTPVQSVQHKSASQCKWVIWVI